jgi:hypothetical protein
MKVAGQPHVLAVLFLGTQPFWELNWKLGGLQSLSGRFGEQKNIFNPYREPNCGLPFE